MIGCMTNIVNADNFALAETHRMMHDLQANTGGVNRFLHNREPAAIDNQTVIRLNRDTLYSFAVVDTSVHSAGPLGSGLLASGELGDHIRRIQARLRGGRLGEI